MGYEVKYSYHPREEGGRYKHEEVLTKVVKIGKPFDDTSLETVAASILAQMARRDILVFDVEIAQFVKQTISFKECKDGKGILIKNKKYSFDEAAKLVASDWEEEASEPVNTGVNLATRVPQDVSIKPSTGSVKVGNIEVNQNRVLEKVTFDPAYVPSEKILQSLKFTEGRIYSVHKKDGPMWYVTDDRGKVVKVNELYFVSATPGIGAQYNVKSGTTDLAYGGEIIDDNFSIR